MMGRLFIASQAAELIGIDAQTLRDWRRRGILDGIGVPVGKRPDWGYTEKECQAIAEAYRKSKIPQPTIRDFILSELESQL
jgi:predicted site-specific integrase-resolvase